jgi:hypothetical protein
MVMNLNRQVVEIGLWWEGMRRLRNISVRKVGSLVEIPTGFISRALPQHQHNLLHVVFWKGI